MRELLDELATTLPASDVTAGLRMTLREPVPPEALEAYVSGLPLRLTGSYPAFLAETDGLDFFGATVFGRNPPEDVNPEDVAELLKRRLVPFHAWRGGDFDCLDLTKAVDGEPPVAFWSEEMERVFAITHSFAKWLPMAHHEIGRFGKLLHPEDYYEDRYRDAQGLYESIANVKKTFFDGGELEKDIVIPPPPGRRERISRFLRSRLRRN